MDSKKKKKTTIKKFLDIDGLSHLINLFTSFVASYAAPKNHNHDTTYAAKSHTHDDRYYTEAEVDNKLGGKAPTSHTHSIANVTNLQSQLDGKQPKGLYAASSHNHDASNITNGTVSADRLPVIPVSKGGTGRTTMVDSANALINSLSNGDATPTDKDYYICQYAGGGTTTTTYHRRSMSALWTWIKSKCDAIYQAKGSYASSSHTHTWSQITGRPSIPSALTYMPVGYVYISWSSTSPASLFGGSWTAITGRFPYFNAGTGQGGSNSHTLSVNEMPSHNHRYNNYDWLVYIGKAGAGGDNAPQQFVPQGSYCLMSGQGRMLAANISGVNTGGNAAHNNMPSYQTLYAWRRTA